VYGGESQHSEAIPGEVRLLEERGLLSEADNGAKIIDLTAYKLDKTVIVKQDGTTIYLTRDIAAAVKRWNEHHFEKMFYVVAAPQTLHFSQLFKILELTGRDWCQRCQHISFGLVRGMSTRSGEVVFLSDVFEEAKQVMLQQMKDSEKTKITEIEDPEKTAEMIGLSAIVVADLSAKRIKDYTFEWERVTSFEGDTGPYLQYNHARLCGIMRKAREQNGWYLDFDNEQFDYSVLTEPQARELAFHVSRYVKSKIFLSKKLTFCRYPQTVDQTFKSLEPCTIVNYLFGLCRSISSANSVLNVIHADEPVGRARLMLFEAARRVLKDGLELLGLEPLYKM
jgi:arginyl-tRNA synthetase